MRNMDDGCTRPVRILHVLHGMAHGGIETWLMRVLRHIDRDRYHFDFMTHTGQKYDYDDEIRSLGSGIYPCLKPSRPWAYARNFRRIVEEHGPYDVVHSHCYLLSGYILRLAAGMGIPARIAHIYPHVDKRAQTIKRRAYRWLMTRWINRYATAVLGCSATGLDAFNADGPKQVCPGGVVYCGLDLSPFARQVDRDVVRRNLGLPTDRPLVVYVARFSEHKNQSQVFRIAEMMEREDYPVHFALVGSTGNMLDEVVARAQKAPNVTAFTSLTDITDILLAADAFFMPSLNEGFGIVVTEASAAGLPIIATDLPTLREATPPEHHDLMFEPNDDVAAATGIRRVLEDAALARRLGEAAREWATRFTIDASVRDLLSYYAVDSHPAQRA